jgi:hypothetical protein
MNRRTFEELQAFAEGYQKARLTSEDTLIDVEDWVGWGGYDVNFTGAHLMDGLGDYDLHISAYPAGWLDVLPPVIYSFVLRHKQAEAPNENK